MAACRTRSSACDTHFPALCPARALLARVPLGPRPSLHRLRRRSPGLVRWLRRYYGGVRPLEFVHHRLRLLVFPMRTRGIPPLAKPEISRFPRNELPHMPGSSTTPGRAGARITLPSVLPSMILNTSAPETILFSRLNGWPMRSPVNASPASSQMPPHDSGPVWFATPSLQETFTLYSLPVSPAHQEYKTTSHCRWKTHIADTTAFRFYALGFAT